MRTVHKKHRDLQRAFPVGECCLCGGELYRGEICWHLAGRTLCGDCAGTWLADKLTACRLRLREVRR
ncbi:MAG: hypothetical protein K2O45_14075 [Oscillospiraceae bacterium]|nr:hypothetical protein [Oscillospiraceae bacterium]